MTKKPTWPTPAAAWKIPLYGGMVYCYAKRDALVQAHHYLTFKDPKAEPPNVALAGVTQTYEHVDLSNNHGEVIYLVGWFDSELATLVHECAHVALFVCRRVGIEIDTSTRCEPFCYLLDNMFNALLPRKHR